MYRIIPDGFYGELFRPEQNNYPGKILICFSGISKGAGLALMAGSLLPGLISGVVAVAPMNTVCQGFAKAKGITILQGSTWSFQGFGYSINGSRRNIWAF